MNIYTLFAIDEEPETRLRGDKCHDIIGVFESFTQAHEVAVRYKCNHDTLLITRSVLGGIYFSSEEVWRWDIQLNRISS